MNFGLSTIFVIITVLAANCAAVTARSSLFTNAVNLLTYCAITLSFSGLASERRRPFWIAYVSTSSILMLLVFTKSSAMTALIRELTFAIDAWRVLPDADQDARYFPLENLRLALESLIPPIAGIGSGFIATVIFKAGERCEASD